MGGAGYESGVFWRLDEPTIARLLRAEGWTPVTVEDPPGRVYPPHRHDETKLIAVIHGGIEVRVGDEIFRCLSGDKLIVPGGTDHAAMVGPDGCRFLWSEQHRGVAADTPGVAEIGSAYEEPVG